MGSWSLLQFKDKNKSLQFKDNHKTRKTKKLLGYSSLPSEIDCWTWSTPSLWYKKWMLEGTRRGFYKHQIVVWRSITTYSSSEEVRTKIDQAFNHSIVVLLKTTPNKARTCKKLVYWTTNEGQPIQPRAWCPCDTLTIQVTSEGLLTIQVTRKYLAACHGDYEILYHFINKCLS